VPSLWTVGPNENEDGSFYIMKRDDGAYVLVKRYAKERYNEHRKGNGREDFYEPEYDSKNPTEFVAKVNHFKTTLPSIKPPALPQSPLANSPISESDDNTWKYEGIPLNFKETEDKFAKLDDVALEHVKKDIIAVIDAGNTFVKLGLPYPKLGYYTDELHVINAEIRKRQNKGPLKEEGESAPVGSMGSQIFTADSVPFYAYSGLLKRRNK